MESDEIKHLTSDSTHEAHHGPNDDGGISVNVCDVKSEYCETMVTDDDLQDDAVTKDATCDNILSKPITIECLGIQSESGSEPNILTDERNVSNKIINIHSSVGDVSSIDPAPHVDAVLAKEPDEMGIQSKESSSPVTMSIAGMSSIKVNYENVPNCDESNANSVDNSSCSEMLEEANRNSVIGSANNQQQTNLNTGNSVTATVNPDQACNLNDSLVEMQEGKRNEIIVDAMNKDHAWKNDTAYQKDLSSLKLLCDYGTDSDEDNNVEEKVNVKSNEAVNGESNGSETPSAKDIEIVTCSVSQQNYRKPESEKSDTEDEDDDSSEEESSTSSSSEETSSSSEESDESSTNECVIVAEKKRPVEIPKTKGELGLEDLPPIEELHISVPESLCVEIGKVLSIVDSLVVVQSIKGCPSLDLDSILFLDHGQNTLGQVFDVFGKVGEACYCVRFNSKDQILERGVEIGTPVYYAPQTEYSKFVFLADLMRMKGSDASWEHNNEPPAKFLDYSDDEEERQAKKGEKPLCRQVDVEETQPLAKRSARWGNRSRGGGRGRGGVSGPDSTPWWGSPFSTHRGQRSSATNDPDVAGPAPLLRPASIQAPTRPHFKQNVRQSVAPALSPWSVPPPALRQAEQFRFSSPPPPSFVPTRPPPPPSPSVSPCNQMPSTHHMSGNFGNPSGGFGAPSRAFGTPPAAFGSPVNTSFLSGSFNSAFGTSSGGFSSSTGGFVNPGGFDQSQSPGNPFISQNVGPRPFEAINFGSRPFSHVQLPQDFGSLRSDLNGSLTRNGGSVNPRQFGPRGPMFQNHNSNMPPSSGW